MQATISLGLVTTLDVATARRLHDYGELDDNGVASALEQTGLQQSSGRQYPDHLTRVVQIAAVIDSGEDITLASFEAANIDEEASVLTTLFALCPDLPGRAVSWDAGAWTLLLRRAYLHMLPAPQAVRTWPRQPLRRLFDNPGRMPDYDTQTDAIKLYGNDAADLKHIDSALRTAIHWHDMDLRWRCVQGEIDPQTRLDHINRLIAQINSKTAEQNFEGDA